MLRICSLAFGCLVAGSPASSGVCPDGLTCGADDDGSLLQVGRQGRRLSASQRSELYVLGFEPYSGYSGPLAVGGGLKVQFSGTTMLVTWEFDGADANCGSVPLPNGRVSNDCGIHIHEATDCAGDALGHFYKTKTDPWKGVRYEVASGWWRAQSKGNAGLDAGLTSSDAVGRAVVVHDITGARVACGLLQTQSSISVQPLKVAFLVPYPGYTGPLVVKGHMEIWTIGGVQYMSWRLVGADFNCGVAPYPNGAASNDCGIHIHTGTTCHDAAAVGGHFYKTASDPWLRVHYAVRAGVAQTPSVRVSAGLGRADIENRVMIVHDITGGRIACGRITNP